MPIVTRCSSVATSFGNLSFSKINDTELGNQRLFAAVHVSQLLTQLQLHNN